MTVENLENHDPHELEGLTHYTDVLISAFPIPIARKELAQKVGVTQAAITKVKDRLFKLCDKNALIFGRKLILRTDETFWRLLVLYFLQMKPTKMLLSNYGREMIKKMNIHSKISERIEEYPSHFREEDTETILRIALYNIGNFQITNQIKTSIGNPQQRMTLLSTQYTTAMESILRKLDLPIESIEDLLSILTIRDRLFYLARQLIWQRVQKTSILQELSKTERITYLKVYSKTIDFYLAKLFHIATDFIKRAAERRKLEFKEAYEKIGHFYKPLQK